MLSVLGIKPRAHRTRGVATKRVKATTFGHDNYMQLCISLDARRSASTVGVNAHFFNISFDLSRDVRNRNFISIRIQFGYLKKNSDFVRNNFGSVRFEKNSDSVQIL